MLRLLPYTKTLIPTSLVPNEIVSVLSPIISAGHNQSHFSWFSYYKGIISADGFHRYTGFGIRSISPELFGKFHQLDDRTQIEITCVMRPGFYIIFLAWSILRIACAVESVIYGGLLGTLLIFPAVGIYFS